MTLDAFTQSLSSPVPPAGLAAPLLALWWDRRGDWARAHALVDQLETPQAMHVHAYLHRKEGEDWNAGYWYRRAGQDHYQGTLDEEWHALVASLLAPA